MAPIQRSSCFLSFSTARLIVSTFVLALSVVSKYTQESIRYAYPEPKIAVRLGSPPGPGSGTVRGVSYVESVGDSFSYMDFETKAESRYALVCTICCCVFHLVTHAYVLSNLAPERWSSLVGSEKGSVQKPTVLQYRLLTKLLYRPFLAAPSYNVDQTYSIGKVEVLNLSKTGHCIDDEQSLAGIAARQWMSTLYIPVDVINHVRKEGGKVALL